MLNEKTRLTIPHANHEAKQVKGGWTHYWTQASKTDMMERLGRYEDTGLTPGEVQDLLDGVQSALRGMAAVESEGDKR